MSPHSPSARGGFPRLRIGVVGCGLIAQVMHLPYLRELHERFEVTALCDISAAARSFAAEQFFPEARRLERWEDVVAESLDAVMVLTPGSHAPVAIAAAEAGAHVFVEKPMCFSTDEGAAMVAAADRAGVRLMVGYVKRYDPAYERAVERVGGMSDLRLVRVTTLEAPLEPYVAHYPLRRAADVDEGTLAALAEDDRARVREAIGAAADDPVLHRAYRVVLLDCLVHELNALRGLLGEPDELRFAAVSGEATGLTAVLRFGSAECVLVWADLPGLTRYEQELAFYAPGSRMAISFPSPFLRSMPARLLSESGGPDTVASARSEEIVSFEEAFKRELVEFHEAVTGEREPRTPGRDGIRDVALAQAFVRCAGAGEPVASPSAVELPVSGGGE